MNQLESLELKIAKFLRMGVLVAGLFMSIGWISQLLYQHHTFALLKTYHPILLSDTLKLAINNHAWSELIAYIGLTLLIALPITRVFLTAFLFVKQKEYMLAGIASFVLLALIISFSLGIEL